MKFRKRYIWLVILFIYICSVAYLCFMKTDEMPTIDPYLWGIPVDKLVHFAMFFPYPFLAYAAFQPHDKRRYIHFIVLLIVVIVGAGLAVGTEQIQGILEYRSYDIADYMADMIGMGSSAFIIALYVLFRKLDITNE
jgi:VanZ family protein